MSTITCSVKALVTRRATVPGEWSRMASSTHLFSNGARCRSSNTISATVSSNTHKNPKRLVAVAQWVKPLLIGHSACWPDGLSQTWIQIQVWKGVFQLDWPSGHAARLNSQTGTEGSLVSSLNCDRPLCSGIRAPEAVMRTGSQTTDSPYAMQPSL